MITASPGEVTDKEELHEVTIATRGKTPDSYGDKVERITIQRTNEESMREALQGKHFDVVIDKIAYCSNDIRYAMDYVDCDKYIYMSSTSVYNPKHMNTVESDFDGYSKDFVWCDRKEFPYSYLDLTDKEKAALFQFVPDDNNYNLELHMTALKACGLKLDFDEVYEDCQKIYDKTMEMQGDKKNERGESGRGRAR